MSIKFRCPEGHKLNVADDLAGRKARCPVCRVKMRVPAVGCDPEFVAPAAPETEDRQASDSLTVESPLGTKTKAADKKRIDRPDRGKIQTVNLLAFALAAVAIFNAGPALVKHWNLLAAPDWARLVLLVAVLQGVYIAWMTSIPDWSTVWVGMLVFALVSTAYAVAMAVVMFTPLDTPLALGLSDVRHSAAGWCFAVLALNGMMTYTCGRVAGRWRRAYEVARIRESVVSG